jgi:MFS family permease
MEDTISQGLDIFCPDYSTSSQDLKTESRGEELMATFNQSAVRGWAIVIWFTCWMACMTYNLVVFPAYAPVTMETYGIEQVGLTTLASVTSVVGAVTGLFFGRLLDTKNVKLLIVVFMAIGIVLFFARAFMTSYPVVVALTFLASACVGIVQVAQPKVINSWFPPEKIGIAMVLGGAGAGIGSAGGFALGAVISMQTALLAIGGIYLVLLVVWVFIGGEGGYKTADQAEAQAAIQGKTSTVFKSKYLWFIMIALALAVTCSLLVNTYMINAFLSKGLEPVQTSLMATALNLSLLLGGFLMTPILAFVKRFNLLLIICMAGGGVFVLLGWFMPLGIQTWIFVVIGGLMFGGSLGLCAGRIPLIPLTGQYTPELIGTASGLNETFKSLFSFVVPILVATALGANFNGIFITFAICCALTVVFGALLVPELGEKGEIFKRQSQDSL